MRGPATSCSLADHQIGPQRRVTRAGARRRGTSHRAALSQFAEVDRRHRRPHRVFRRRAGPRRQGRSAADVRGSAVRRAALSRKRHGGSSTSRRSRVCAAIDAACARRLPPIVSRAAAATTMEAGAASGSSSRAGRDTAGREAFAVAICYFAELDRARRRSQHARPRAPTAARLTLESLEPRHCARRRGPSSRLAVQPTGQLCGQDRLHVRRPRLAVERRRSVATPPTAATTTRSSRTSATRTRSRSTPTTCSAPAPRSCRCGRSAVRLNEVVLDNDSAGVTYTGSWSNSASAVHYDEDYGAVADAVAYRFASDQRDRNGRRPPTRRTFRRPASIRCTRGCSTAPIAPTQLYRITDSDGGVTEIRVDHRMVGKGWVYLGTYHFDAGAGGNVQISNQSPRRRRR